jgi:hypothetical protein
MIRLMIWIVAGTMVVSGCKSRQKHFVPEQEPIVREYFSISEIDTSIIVPAVAFDTVFQWVTDTVTLIDSVTQIKLQIVRLPGDSIWIKPECPPDTVTVTKYRSERVTERQTERVYGILDGKGKHILIVLLVGIAALFAAGYLANALKR